MSAREEKFKVTLNTKTCIQNTCGLSNNTEQTSKAHSEKHIRFQSFVTCHWSIPFAHAPERPEEKNKYHFISPLLKQKTFRQPEKNSSFSYFSSLHRTCLSPQKLFGSGNGISFQCNPTPQVTKTIQNHDVIALAIPRHTSQHIWILLPRWQEAAWLVGLKSDFPWKSYCTGRFLLKSMTGTCFEVQLVFEGKGKFPWHLLLDFHPMTRQLEKESCHSSIMTIYCH